MFKGQADDRVYRRLHTNSLVNHKNVLAYCQPKAWKKEIIMKTGSTRFGGSTLILYWRRTQL